MKEILDSPFSTAANTFQQSILVAESVGVTVVLQTEENVDEYFNS